KLKGTFRAMDEDWRYRAHELIKQEAMTIAKAMGAEADVDIPAGYPSLKNDEVITNAAQGFAVQYMGKENVETVAKRMGGEDFSFYSQEIPACFYRLGVGNVAKGITSNVHTPTFNIDEQAIETGMGLMAYLGLKLLER